jgi:hypothetical protein
MRPDFYKIIIIKWGQNDAFLSSEAYSSAKRKTPSIVWHSFSATFFD